MPIAHEVNIETQPTSCASLFQHLKPLMQRLLNLPVIRGIHPIARKVRAVTEPVGRLTVQRHHDLRLRRPGQPVTILSANLRHDFPMYRQFYHRLESFAGIAEAQEADVILLKKYHAVLTRLGLRK